MSKNPQRILVAALQPGVLMDNQESPQVSFPIVAIDLSQVSISPCVLWVVSEVRFRGSVTQPSVTPRRPVLPGGPGVLGAGVVSVAPLFSMVTMTTFPWRAAVGGDSCIFWPKCESYTESNPSAGSGVDWEHNRHQTDLVWVSATCSPSCSPAYTHLTNLQ
jgi:hypothetical protein